MKKVVVSAPGKLHLSGEHAVVHGKPAVVVATSKRMYVTVEEDNSPASLAKLTSRSEQLTDHSKIEEIRSQDDYLAEIIRSVEKKYQTVLNGFSLHITSDIPIGAGMGSSAALAVCLVAALTQWLDKPWNPAEINELAFQAEKFKHINASGSDPTIVTYGGLLWYRKELDFLKTFWLLPFKIPKSFAPFVLINTGRVETTGDLVKNVGKLRQKDVDDFILLITRIEEVTRNLVLTIHDEKEIEFRQLISENELLLEQLGVVSSSTKKLIRDIEKAGGVAKISGAGGIKKGSGIVIAIHDHPQKLIQIAQKYRYPVFQTQLGGEGVKIEQIVV